MQLRPSSFVTAFAAGLILILAACSSDPLAQPSKATVLPSGLAYVVLQEGKGTTHPALSDMVKVNYTLWSGTSKQQLESTWDAKGNATPANFPLGKLIPGWQQLLPLMTPGERVRAWLPSNLAYGDHPTRADHPPAGPLIFEIELVSVGN